MIRCGVSLLLGLACATAAAAPWEFQAPVAVTAAHGPKLFHHLESAGRKNLAVAGDTVAVTWEDNRSGGARVYVAFKPAAAKAFVRERQVSAAGPAYEPVIAALGRDRFLVGWEEGARLWLRSVSRGALGRPVAVNAAEAAQVSLAVSPAGAVYAAWAARDGTYTRIYVAEITLADDDTPRVGAPRAVDAAPPRADQLYPCLAVTERGTLVVAWEDRRPGHTIILGSRAADGAQFTPPQRVNELLPQRSQTYGRGTGVARVALAHAGGEDVIAVWDDKRDFEVGYDVYAAASRGGAFGANQKVQDGFGDTVEQWHPAIAAHPSGLSAVVWDDDRDDSADIWLAWNTPAGWSDNLAVPGASGAGQQTSPVVVLDAQGNLHLAWIERTALDGPTRIKYALGRRTDAR